jgi:hypothetical protein
MSDYVIGCFAVAFRFCCSPGPLQFLPSIVGWLREGENESGPRGSHLRKSPRSTAAYYFSFDDGN